MPATAMRIATSRASSLAVDTPAGTVARVFFSAPSPRDDGPRVVRAGERGGVATSRRGVGGGFFARPPCDEWSIGRSGPFGGGRLVALMRGSSLHHLVWPLPSRIHF